MSPPALQFDHVLLISEDPEAAVAWYRDVLGGQIIASCNIRGAPQIAVAFGSVTILIRGKRQGEEPGQKNSRTHFADYVSHDQWGTDHFGFSIRGDLPTFCETLKARGAQFSVTPCEFLPGRTIAYLKAPDGVTVELTNAHSYG